MKKFITFIVAHSGEIGFILAAIMFVLTTAFLVTGNAIAAGLTIGIGLLIWAPFRIVGEFSHEINTIKTKE